MKKDKGLEDWLPIEGEPSIFAYSNLIRNGVPEQKAYEAIKRELIKCGKFKEEDFPPRTSQNGKTKK